MSNVSITSYLRLKLFHVPFKDKTLTSGELVKARSFISLYWAKLLAAPTAWQGSKPRVAVTARIKIRMVYAA